MTNNKNQDKQKLSVKGDLNDIIENNWNIYKLSESIKLKTSSSTSSICPC
jgi:hypothetical protein